LSGAEFGVSSLPIESASALSLLLMKDVSRRKLAKRLHPFNVREIASKLCGKLALKNSNRLADCNRLLTEV
jgi:hypothetical protein